jgi:hypothetical protein
MLRHALMNIDPCRITHSYNGAGVLSGIKNNDIAFFRGEACWLK